MTHMSGIQSVSVSASQSYASVATQPQQSLQPFASLDLTEAQRTQLRSIFTAAKQSGTSKADVQQQVNAVLTPAQQQTLASNIKADGGGSGHHRHHDSDSSTSPTSATATDSSTTTSSASPSSTILDTITNIQNQAAAAQSTLVENLQKQLLADDGGTATA
jgi:hypothetical protein